MSEYDELCEQVNEYSFQKHELIRQFDRNEISRQKFNGRYKKVTDELDELVRRKLELASEMYKEKEKQATNNKRETTKQLNKIKKENRKRAGRKINPDSYASHIIKALMYPNINNEDKVVAVVNKWKPGKSEKSLRMQIKNIISTIKKAESGAYADYTFDKDKYMVYKKRS